MALMSRVRGANTLFGQFSRNYTKMNKTEWGGAGGEGWRGRHVPNLFTYIRHCLSGIIDLTRLFRVTLSWLITFRDRTSPEAKTIAA